MLGILSTLLGLLQCDVYALLLLQGVPDAVVVTQFHHTKWPERAHPPSTSSILKIMDALIKTQMTTGNHSITVMCKSVICDVARIMCCSTCSLVPRLWQSVSFSCKCLGTY